MKVQVITPEEQAERNARFRALRDVSPALMRDSFELAEMTDRGTTLLFWHEPDDGSSPLGGFSWLCPGCGRWLYGQIGEQPVSGWDAPRWVNSGTPESPTLTPSLGCGGWRHGTCPEGHYWLRDGELTPA